VLWPGIVMGGKSDWKSLSEKPQMWKVSEYGLDGNGA
jgi:hypothetical protein